MKKYLCIVKPLIVEEFYSFLELLDEENTEIHVYDREETDLTVETLDYNYKETDQYCFVTDSMQLLYQAYYILDNCLDGYILYNRELKETSFSNQDKNDKYIDIVNLLIERNKLYWSDPYLLPSLLQKNSCLLYQDARIYAFDIDIIFEQLNFFYKIKAKQLVQILSLQQRVEPFKNRLLNESRERKEEFRKYIEYKIRDASDYAKLYFYSFLYKNWKDSSYIEIIIELIQYSVEFTTEIKFFLYYQLKNWFFLSSTNMITMKRSMQTLYKGIYEDYYAKLSAYFEFIPPEERNDNVVIVFTGQLLSLNHGPTKTALDRCYILKKHLNKEVLLINTAELLSTAAAIPIWDMMYGLYQERYSKYSEFPYKDTSFPLLQCTNQMPNLSEIIKIIQLVKEQRPCFIISVGSTLTADLCSNIVPVITLATVLSSLVNTEGQFQQIGRKLNKEDVEYLRQCGKEKEHVIEGIFTYEFKQQNTQFTRAKLGLPEDKFIIITAGARLDDEISEDFIQLLLNLFHYSVFIVFIGRFDHGYKMYCEKYAEFKRNTAYLGFQSDVLAIFECCDLYVNPKRKGGGGAILEAMYQGLPSVTLNYGDAAVTAGEEFIVSDNQEMLEEIIHYATDGKYYHIKSELAKKRAEYMCDSKRHFLDIIQTAMERDSFSYPPVRRESIFVLEKPETKE